MNTTIMETSVCLLYFVVFDSMTDFQIFFVGRLLLVELESGARREVSTR
jgi:hypothetical protein